MDMYIYNIMIIKSRLVFVDYVLLNTLENWEK